MAAGCGAALPCPYRTRRSHPPTGAGGGLCALHHPAPDPAPRNPARRPPCRLRAGPSRRAGGGALPGQTKGRSMMTAAAQDDVQTSITEPTLRREALPVLRQLARNGTVLAVAQDMQKAVVVRDRLDGTPERLDVIPRELAEAMALKDWITCKSPGRISRYAITSSGRSTLNALIAKEENTARGFAEGVAPSKCARRRRPRRRSTGRAVASASATARWPRWPGAGTVTEPLPAPGTGAGGRAAARGFRAGPGGTKCDPGLGPVPDRWHGERAERQRPLSRDRRPPVPASRRPCRILGLAWPTWPCAAAVTWRGWRRRSARWAGPRARARSSCGSRWIG